MPLTPFHFGPAALLGVLLPRRLDLPTLLVGSVIIDVRALLVVTGVLDPPVHGILTTVAGATVVAVALAGAVMALPGSLQSVLEHGRLGSTNAFGPILTGGLVGTYSHVLLDSLLYADAAPFWPLRTNPLLLGRDAPVTEACVAAGLAAIAVYLLFVRPERADQ